MNNKSASLQVIGSCLLSFFTLGIYLSTLIGVDGVHFLSGTDGMNNIAPLA